MKLYTLPAALLLSSSAFAQSFSTSGSKTVENLDATAASHHTFYNIATGKTVAYTDSATTSWDIAFKGTSVIVNSGTSGPGIVEAQLVASDYAALIEAPATGYMTSTPGKWYHYNGATHVISPLSNKTIAVKLADGIFAKIQILSYYKDRNISGTTRFYTFRITKSATTTLGTTLTAVSNLKSNGSHFQFFNLAKADTVSAADSASTAWDIAFRGTAILINGGTSGPGTDSAQIVLHPFDAITVAPAQGWKADAASKPVLTVGSDLGWYTYNETTHIISPIAGRTILVKTSTGKYVKIKILSYYKDANSANASRYYTFVYEYQADGSDVLRATESNTITGVEDIAFAANSTVVYPNPLAASGILKFNEDVNLVKVFNAQGAEAVSAVPSSNELELASFGLQPGFYTIQLTTGNSVKTTKIIIQ